MLQQFITPAKGIFYAGESITIDLTNIPDIPGRAVFRSNLPGVKQHRREIISHYTYGTAIQDLDWCDIEIPGSGSRRTLTLPLTDVGIFEGKCCFIPEGPSQIIWVSGDNIRIKVLPAETIAGNTVYSAFVRQFGRNLYKPFSDREPEEISFLEQNAYSVLPPSGTFRQLIRHLDHIFDTLNCRILQLLPIHPVPAQYGQMGRFGSPFAPLDYFSIEPTLAEFDTRATPMEQFEELLNAVHSREGKLFLDIPVNHTGWASKLQQQHPEYFVRSADHTFESPGAWGIVWADLCKLDYTRKEVAQTMAEVFLFWCAKGVDGFRCDAGYMVPENAWDYIVAKVRSSYPDTIFLLEGLGGPQEVQNRLLQHSGLDWAYSEMFQNYSRAGMEYCLQYMLHSAQSAGTLISFSETHDNNRLADSGKTFARFRFLACALLSLNGAFGFANGAEFFAREKIDVHKDSALNFGALENLCSLTGSLNHLLSCHPAFTGNSKITSVTLNPGEGMALLRSAYDNSSRVLVLLNPECSNTAFVQFPGNLPDSGTDLLTGQTLSFVRSNNTLGIDLPPGSGFAVALDPFEWPDISPATHQQIKVMEKRAFLALKGWQDEQLPVTSFADSPEQFVSELASMSPPPLSIWEGSRDFKRIVPIPAGDLLLVRNPYPFRCRILEEGSGFIKGVPLKEGSFAALLTLEKNTSPHRLHKELLFESFEPGKCVKRRALLCHLPEYERFAFRREYSQEEVRRFSIEAFGSNDNSSYALFPAALGDFSSKYSALLAVNGASDMPFDRYCLFTGLHIYLVVEGYSRKVDINSLESFTSPAPNRGDWKFRIPAGQGRSMCLELRMRFPFTGDAVELEFFRPVQSGVPDTTPAALILRPEVEDRINHHVTRACDGPEWQFPAAVQDYAQGFTFAPGERKLELSVSKGSWHPEREWHYMCELPAERYYGLEDKTDRYSPGYFHIPLQEKERFTLTACAGEKNKCVWDETEKNTSDPLLAAMRRFVLKRGNLSTVIAGYPWFLDWGRDTLIALRGLLKAPEFHPQCAEILRAFASFEDRGTIPNVLSGSNTSNRDTSDAPLYLILGVRDYIAETKDTSILETFCGTRKLKEIVDSIVSHYISGTPNGIKQDPASGLIFSPSHFTWMDTNFPAGTPREGYPVEIQALWYAVLKFVKRDDMAEQVQNAIEKYFFSTFEGVSDCLHAPRHTPAAQAVADDHIRSNALLLITMGAVRKKDLCSGILRSCAELLVPGAIRTLADRQVKYLLPVKYDGRLLNDPANPYCGRYAGPENDSRKVAYHNGTAWCWPFPAYCEALCICGGAAEKKRALSLLLSGAEYLERTIPGQLSEVADGNAPHAPGGCPAQAWSVTELFRVREILQNM